jgi:hypothetical protein
MLDIALSCVERGWFVFPCWPRSKKPMTAAGFKDASADPLQITEWWTRQPDANVAIATGPSGLCVVDIDHGFEDEQDFWRWLGDHEYADTYVVRTGRRRTFGVQLYYSGVGLKSTGWDAGDIRGDVRCATGYVMAAGSIHPDSGERYSVLCGMSPIPVPDYVCALTVKVQERDAATSVSDETADAWKTWLLEYANDCRIPLRDFEKRVDNGWWLGIECPWVTEHTSGAGAESSTVMGILDGKIAFECSHSTCKAAKRNTAAFKRFNGDADEPGADPEVRIGTGLPMPKAKVDADWRTMFHSKDDMVSCAPPSFLIDQFLAHESICAIAAPVAQRKSLIALNMAHALITKKPLFGHLEVLAQPSRVLYLCPEMGLISMSNRVKRIGLTEYLGETLFIRTMNLEEIDLDDIPDEAIDGSVLIVDTAIRFMKGEENSATAVKDFSKILFRTQKRQGPRGAIVVLYHSPKSTKGAFELTLENCMRGSGELGAAITDAHGTRLNLTDSNTEYTATSYISHVKSRDYKGLEAFEADCNEETCLMTKVGEVGVRAVLNVKQGGFKANADGQDAAADAVILANPDMSLDKLEALFEELGIARKRTWISKRRAKILGKGSKHTEG